LLVRTLRRFYNSCHAVGLTSEANFAPQAWILPRERPQLAAYCISHPDQVFIYKPPARSCGTGIVLFAARHMHRVPTHLPAVVQEYLASPYLGISTTKFDLRVYVWHVHKGASWTWECSEGLRGVRRSSGPQPEDRDLVPLSSLVAWVYLCISVCFAPRSCAGSLCICPYLGSPMWVRLGMSW
jgi:hypothetical protein